jgi:hypothetical protein
VQRQLGHASIQLTVDTYGKWLPMADKAAVDRLDSTPVPEPSGSTMVATGGGGRHDVPQLREKPSAPRVIRTPDILIRSRFHPSNGSRHLRIRARCATRSAPAAVSRFSGVERLSPYTSLTAGERPGRARSRGRTRESWRRVALIGNQTGGRNPRLLGRFRGTCQDTVRGRLRGPGP